MSMAARRQVCVALFRYTEGGGRGGVGRRKTGGKLHTEGTRKIRGTPEMNRYREDCRVAYCRGRSVLHVAEVRWFTAGCYVAR